METSVNYIVFLWFLPVFILILIPLTISFIYLFVHCVKEISKGNIPYLHQYLSSYYGRREGLQQRCEQRFYIDQPVVVEVSDKNTSMSGVLTNISNCGMCIGKLSGFVSTTSRSFNIQVETQHSGKLVIEGILEWLNGDGLGSQTIGLSVNNNKSEWAEFVLAY